MPADQEFDEYKEETMSQSSEKAPGVYVRTGEYQPHELDMLWSGSRHFAKEDRSPVVFTVVGLVVGVIITSALFFLFNSKPDIKAGDNELLAPIVDETQLVPTAGDPLMGPEIVQPDFEPVPVAVTTPVKTPSTTTTKRMTSTATYVVQNGDTLEKIARRYYGSSEPALIQKISRANKMNNPNSLKIGQRLVIPPKAY